MQLRGYEVLEKLGEGGTAKVYLVEKRGLGDFRKLCVLKCLKPSLARDSVVREDFLAEARLSARMSHPNVVQVYEVFEVSGVPILAMEYLDGPPLSVLRGDLRSALSLELELFVLTEVLKGLHYVHELKRDDGRSLGVVHRDVSPQNLVVTYDGDVKLLDFGIAKLAASEQTEYGIIKGKIAYLAPEQLRASETDTIDRRADLFAMGILLWEAAARRPMWSGVSEGEVLVRLIEGRFPMLPPPSSDCAKALAPIVDRALRLDPGERFATAEEMREALVAVLEAFDRRPTKAALKAQLEEHYGSERRPIWDSEQPAGGAYDSSLELFRSLSDPPSSPAESATALGSRSTRNGSRWTLGIGFGLVSLLVAGLGYARLTAPRQSATVADADVRREPEASDTPETITSTIEPQRESAPCPDPFFISDFEGGRVEACRTEERRGSAYVLYFDGTGEVVPAAGVLEQSVLLETPRGTSKHALYIRGTGLTDWGAGVSVMLDEGRPIDLREYEGLRLWLRSDTNPRIRISVATQTTLDETYGGQCVPHLKPCNDHYAAQRVVGSFWQEFRVPLAGLQQLGWGRVAPWRPDLALEIHLGVHNGENGKDGARTESLSFDLWVDDLSFY